jgi:hypothetical protein
VRIPALLFTVAIAVTPALAQNAVAINSNIQAVKVVTDAKGVKTNTLVAPTTVVPGTPLVIWVRYKNGGGRAASNFVINNPTPKSVDFTAFGQNSDWGQVSVDGGKTFGPLATLKVTKADQTLRAALPSDVTNIRWTFAKPIPAGGAGTLSFYGVVQ